MKVSIIVPVYNVEKYIDICIQSVLAQSYREWELILINDGSTDSSGKICDEYAVNNNRIIVRHTVNQGVAAAWNTGVELAQGDYIIGLDSDDFWEKDLLIKCVQTIEKYNCDMVVFGYLNYYAEDKKVANKIDIPTGLYDENNLDIIRNGIINRGCIENRSTLYLGRINKMIKAGLVKKNAHYCVKGFYFGEDNLYSVPNILSAKSIFVYSDWFPYNYRINQSSITHSYHADLWCQFCDLDSLTLDILHAEGYDSLSWQVYADAVFHSLIAISNVMRGNLSFRQSRREIKKIVSSNMVRNGLKFMQKRKLSFKEKVYLFLMKYKMYSAIYIIKKLV